MNWRRYASGSLMDPAWILTLSLALHLGVAHFYPAVFGGDTIIRLMHPDRLLLSYQLPLFQALLAGLSTLTVELIGMRILMALLAAAAAFGLQVLVTSWIDRGTGRLAAFLFCIHPFLLYYSLVPYQEMLMLALLFPAVERTLHFVRAGRVPSLAIGGVCAALACWTRYEAWVIAAALGVYAGLFATTPRSRAARWTLVLSVFGAAPLAWVLWNGGLHPAGTYVLDPNLDPARFYRWYWVLRKLLGGTTSAIALLAVLGVVWQGLPPRRERRLFAAIALCFLLSLLVSAHNFGDTEVVTEREAHLLVPYLLVPAAWGLQRLVRGPSPGRSRFLLAATLCVLTVYSLKEVRDRLEFAIHQDGLDAAHRAAVALDGLLAGGTEQAAVFAQPLPEAKVAEYLDRVRKLQGPEGEARAREKLRELDPRPFDLQRILVHASPGVRQRIRDWREFEGTAARYAVFFSDFVATEPIARGHRIFCHGDAVKSACIYDNEPRE